MEKVGKLTTYLNNKDATISNVASFFTAEL